jgi:uncharacterized protein (DUF486 family)
MNATRRKRWLRVVILLGVTYLAAGITFGALAGWSASNQMRTTWRLAAWLTSAAAFVAHIWYEYFRLRNSPLTTALHASLAAALGAFALAVAANLHAQWTASGNKRLLAIALAVWPALTAVPAFAVALAVAASLARTRRSD